jgi:hypothetical protein
VHAPEAAEADLAGQCAGQCEKIPLHDARVTSVDCLVMITHVNTNATCFLLFREKSERARTCDWKPAKNLDTEDDDTCPGTEGGATDDCEDDRCNIAYRSSAEPRISASTSGHRNQDVPVASPPPSRHAVFRYGAHLGKCNVFSIICISPRGELTAEMSRRDMPRKEGK